MQPTVFVVSSDTSSQQQMARILRDSCYQVQVAARGADVLEQLSQARPSLILLDWKLADLSGLAVIRMIRADSNEQVSNLPIVLLGSDMSENDRIRGLETGADLCFNSIFPPAIFISHLRSLLRRVSKQ